MRVITCRLAALHASGVPPSLGAKSSPTMSVHCGCRNRASFITPPSSRKITSRDIGAPLNTASTDVLSGGVEAWLVVPVRIVALHRFPDHQSPGHARRPICRDAVRVELPQDQPQ